MQYIRCPECEGPLRTGTVKCVFCGAQVVEEPHVCGNCQTLNGAEEIYCVKCGVVITDQSPQARAFGHVLIRWLQEAGYQADIVKGMPCYTRGTALVLIINEELDVGNRAVHIIRFRSNVVTDVEHLALVEKTILKANTSLLLGSFGLEGNMIVYRYDWVTTEVPQDLFLVIAGMIGEIVDSTDDYLAGLTGGETTLGH